MSKDTKKITKSSLYNLIWAAGTRFLIPISKGHKPLAGWNTESNDVKFLYIYLNNVYRINSQF